MRRLLIGRLPIMKTAFFTPLIFALFLFSLSCSPWPLVNVQQPPAQEKQVEVVTRNGKTVNVGEAACNLHYRELYFEAWKILLLAKNASLYSATVDLERQADVITRNGKTVDVREAALNLHYRELYFEAWKILLLAKNASLYSATMDLERQVDVITRNGKTVDVREAALNLHYRSVYREAWDILHTKNASLSSATVSLLKTVLNNNSKGVANDKFEGIRLCTVALLGLSRNPEAIDTVADCMFNDLAWGVRQVAANALGRLAGEAALPALLEALEKGKISNLSLGFVYAGEKAVPLIIQWLEEDFAENGGRNHAETHITRLYMTGDRRAIEPLLRIIAYPASPSNPTIERVRFKAAITLARFTSEIWYTYPLKGSTDYLAFDPVTRRKNRRVTSADHKRIVKTLQNAGYDVNRLIYPVLMLDADDKVE